MNEYRIKWCKCPTSQNTTRVDFVEAATQEDAEHVMRSHIERAHHCEWFVIDSVELAVPPPEGKVK